MSTKIISGRGTHVLTLFAIVVLAVSVPGVAAEHDAIVTIDPDIANCNELGNTFTVNVENDGDSTHDIYEVRVYNGTGSLADFDCGPAPSGWTLFDFTDPFGYCEYKTAQFGPDVIEPGEDVDFSFDAVMIPLACSSEFLISTLDNAVPVGEHEFNTPDVLIDCSLPEIEKMVGDPSILIDPNCNPDTTTCDYWVTPDTEIEIWADDTQDECDLGLDYCEWRVTLDGDPGEWHHEENGGEIHFFVSDDASFEVDSNHFVEIECVDHAGNVATLEETDKVDGTPPETTKEIGQPFKQVGDVEWITTQTPITLNSEDPDDTGYSCNVGVEETFYRVSLVGDDYCWEPDTYCEPCIEESGCLGFDTYDDTFTIPEESCHMIEFYSVDELGNTEEIQTNCLFVDNTPPASDLEIGEHNIPDEDPNVGPFHWVNQDTPLWLSCQDKGPHPSGMEVLWWRFSVHPNGFNSTPNYTDWFSAPADNGSIELYFQEDSWHDLEYYCVDGLGNTEETHTEYFIVESVPPEIYKYIAGPNVGDCPPGLNDTCYVQAGVEIYVSVTDPQPHPVNEVECEWGYWWNNEFFGWYDDGAYWSVIFEEDSHHDLIIQCNDALWNMVIDEEPFEVDGYPPETVKEYGDPYFSCYDWCEIECDGDENGCMDYCFEEMCGGADQYGHWYPQWINSSTQITLNTWDEKSGVNATWWRNTLVPDEMCWEADLCWPCETEGNCAEWIPYEGPFNKPEESCHLIEYYSVDHVTNVEEIQWQCTFVDNTPPESIKDVGEPSIFIGEGGDANSCNGNGQGGGEFDVGDIVHQLNATHLPFPGYENYCSIGVAFDGENLFYNRCDDPLIYEINPLSGAFVDSFDTGLYEGFDGPNAMAYDGTRNGIWFGTQSCDETGMPIYFWDFDTGNMTLEFHIPFGLINPATNETFLSFCFLDGLAFNANDDGAADDELWLTDDIDYNLGVFRPDGTLVAGYDARDVDPDLSPLSGVAIGGDSLYLGNNGLGDIFRADADTLDLIDQFASEEERLEDMECDPDTFAPTEVMWVRHTPQGAEADDLITAFAIEPGTCGLGGDDPVCNETNGTGIDWYVTQHTPVTFTCLDQQPHPVDHSVACYKVSFHDGDEYQDITDQYCDPNEEGWCCVPAEEGYEFLFQEDSLHDLEFYCEDALGNVGEVDLEYFAVETVPPVTEKTYLGPFYSEDICPEGNQSCETVDWIDTASLVQLEAYDPEPHPSNVSETLYRVTLVDDEYCWYPSQACEPCIEEDGCGDFTVYEGPFGIPEESCHLIEFYSVDNLENQEDLNHQCVFVDKTPPVTVKTYGDPHFTCFDWCAASENPEECLETMCQFTGEEAETLFWDDFDDYSNTHGLDLYKEMGDNGWEIYDYTHPYNDDDIFLSDLDTPDDYYVVVRDQSHITASVNTEGFHSIVLSYDRRTWSLEHNDTLNILWRVGDEGDWTLLETLGEVDWEVKEWLLVGAEDQELVQIRFYLDDGNRDFGLIDDVHVTGRQGNWYPLWISDETWIELEAYDPEPHPSGVDETLWRVTLVDDAACAEVEICHNENLTVGQGDFVSYDEAFHIPEESCHLIEYYSTDNVDKTEQVNRQCAYVDLTPPLPVKEVGEPSDPWTPGIDGDPVSVFYPEANEVCNDGTECWEVTTLTPITLACEDQDPHPVDHSTVCFQVDFDGDDITEDYCDVFNGDLEDGYCCTLNAPLLFYFSEETEHQLSYYCEDALGNQGPEDSEYFKVEGQAFNYTINNKWNLISFPFTLQNSSPESVFADIHEDINSILTYDAGDDEWLIHTFDDIDNDNLEQLLPGRGYWVLATDPTTLLIGGDDFLPGEGFPQVQLSPGWNLVGEYGNYGNDPGEVGHIGDPLFTYDGPLELGRPSACSLGSLIDTTSHFPMWSSLITYWEPDNPDQWYFIDHEGHQDPGAGYWLFLIGGEERLYGFSTTCPPVAI